MKRIFHAVLLFFLLFICIPLNVSAETVPYFTFSLDKESVSAGSMVKLQLNANQTADTAAGFRMGIGYDDKILSFVRTETSGQIKGGTMATNSTCNPIISVYVCNTDAKAAPELSGNIISFVFKVNDGAAVGKTALTVHIDQICNYQAQQMNLNEDENLVLSVEPPAVQPEKKPEKNVSEKSEEAYLSALTAYDGTLRPDFSSDVYAYTMDVDYDVRSVEFAASAGKNGTVKVNRKSLGKAGSSTNIIVTVTSADKTNKEQYCITVRRAMEPQSSETDTRTAAAPSGTKAKKQPSISASSGGRVTRGKAAAAGKTEKSKAEKPESESETPLTGNAEPSEAQMPASAPAQSLLTGGNNRTILLAGNQMPVFVIGLLCAVLCVLVGIALTFWLKLNTKKQ